MALANPDFIVGQMGDLEWKNKLGMRLLEIRLDHVEIESNRFA